MTRLRVIATLTVSYLLVLVIVPWPARAYLDPGTGSYLLQILLAGLLAVGVTIRVYWRNISGFFRRLAGRRREPPSGAADAR
ncbi:MAG TPA: hypothetical protein PLJ35_13800 [Anaerolineae bacterium]|nr:hypothetical protein [Anaerolineae bacterium]HPL28075.1 hypothetical protein [Anaerolineae bacterium]